jgi:hypothetical protein
VESTETIPLAEGKNLSNRKSLIRDDVNVAPVFVMQFQHPYSSEVQLPFEEREKLIPKSHRFFQRVDFSEGECPEIQLRILPKHLPNCEFEGRPTLHPVPV